MSSYDLTNNYDLTTRRIKSLYKARILFISVIIEGKIIGKAKKIGRALPVECSPILEWLCLNLITKLTSDALPQFLYGIRVFLSLLDVEIIHVCMGSGE